VHPQAYLTVGSSLVMTLVIVAAVIARWRRGGSLERADRLALVGAVVIASNAVLSFSYAKDDIVAVAGVFYAVMAFAAIRTTIAWTRTGGVVAAVVGSVLLLALGSAWAVRSSGVHYVTSEHAFRARNDWAELPLRWQRNGRWPTDPKPLALIETLRNEALSSAVPNPQLAPEWRERWYGD
jgi:hypothetical protein